MARLPNKCLHVMVDGAPCGSPAVRHYRFCYHHKRQREQLLELNADRARPSLRTPTPSRSPSPKSYDRSPPARSTTKPPA
jgi:hypothetical protein